VHLVWHEVNFRGPDAAQPCELPENKQGVVEHTFINGSIYKQTFATTISTSPAALHVPGPPSPPPVVVGPAKKGPLRSHPTTAPATQALEHVAGTGIGLPLAATADFATIITPPWVTPISPTAPPTVSIMLTV
jgi:hypothetical protein